MQSKTGKIIPLCLQNGISWIYGDNESIERGARYFFKKIREGFDKGIRFPFECPFQVYLLNNRSAAEFVVAILVLRGTHEDDSIEQYEKLKEWFSECKAFGEDDRIGKSGSWNWRSSYNCMDSFGTFEKCDKSNRDKAEDVSMKTSTERSSSANSPTPRPGKKWWNIWT